MEQLKNHLSSEGEWVKKISELQTSFDALEKNLQKAKQNLTQSVMQSIRSRATKKFGILFSGGVDSSLIALICKNLNLNFTCYTVGLENSQDIEAAKSVASELKLNLKIKLLTMEEFEPIVTKVVRILKEPDVTKVSVGSVLFAASQSAINDNIFSLFSGLGSEELFTGYQRHEQAFTDYESVHNECWDGLRKMYSRDLIRDTLIAQDNKIELKLPFLDFDVIKTAMSIHPMYKISKTENKIILREIAVELGLKKEFAFRKKKAAQYGSNFIKGIDKLAKKNNFKYKKDYLSSLL